MATAKAKVKADALKAEKEANDKRVAAQAEALKVAEVKEEVTEDVEVATEEIANEVEVANEETVNTAEQTPAAEEANEQTEA